MQHVDQDKLRDKLADYVEDAHAFESGVVDNLDTMIGTIDDPKLKEVLQRNRQVSRQHVERLKQRLELLNRGTPVRKRIEGVALALMKGVSDVLRTDSPGKVGRDAYLLAHTQVAAYELLSRLADAAGDTQTAELAREHLAEDKKCADEVAEQWDAFFELTLSGWRDAETATATV
ncbi:MAG: ferritin-like domain-containing protein [Actinomycetota bacterium]|nr:ferritin-like domain-containing protein [Actinomycetota bacterium]